MLTSTHPSHRFAIPWADGVRPEAMTEAPPGDRRSDHPVHDTRTSRWRVERWLAAALARSFSQGFAIAAALPRGRNLPILKERAMVLPREERP